MPIADTGQEATLLVSAATAAGRGAGALGPVVGSASRRVGAVAGGLAVMAMWTAVHGWSNLRKLRKGEISGTQAVQRTTAESVGVGLATGVGIAVTNVARATVFTAASTVLVPFLIGTAVAGGAKAAWERKVAVLLHGRDAGAPAESRDAQPGESTPEPAGPPGLSADDPS